MTLIMDIQLVCTQPFFTPLEDVIEEEFMQSVKNFRSEEYCGIRKAPVPPKQEVHATEIQLFRGLQELVNLPRIDMLSKAVYLLESIYARAGWGRGGRTEFGFGGKCNGRCVLCNTCDHELFWQVSHICDEGRKAVALISGRIHHEFTSSSDCLQGATHNIHTPMPEPSLEDRRIVAMCNELSCEHICNARPGMGCCFHAYIRANVAYCQEKGVHFEAASLSCNGGFV